MKRIIGALALVFLTGIGDAAAQGWKSDVAVEGPRIFYHIRERPNEYFPFALYCNPSTRQFTIAATLGVLRSKPPGNVTVSIGIPGQPAATIQGRADNMPFNDEYWMGGAVSGHNPIFAILARNQPMVYSGGAITSFTMNTQGLAQAVRQFSAACQIPSTQSQSPSQQQTQSQTARYRMTRGDLSGQLIMNTQPDGAVSVSVEFARPGCLGQIDGTGTRQGNRITVQTKPLYANAPKCTLQIDVQGNTLRVEEQNCMMFHGPSCEASGVYVPSR